MFKPGTVINPPVPQPGSYSPPGPSRVSRNWSEADLEMLADLLSQRNLGQQAQDENNQQGQRHSRRSGPHDDNTDYERTIQFRPEELGFFDPQLPISYGGGDIVVLGRDTYYRNVHVFISRIKDLVAAKGPRQILVLRDDAGQRHGQIEAKSQRFVLRIGDAEDRLLRFLSRAAGENVEVLDGRRRQRHEAIQLVHAADGVDHRLPREHLVGEEVAETAAYAGFNGGGHASSGRGMLNVEC